MTDKKTNRTGIREVYYQNFVNIVLAIVSIIQGLAFNDLAQRFSPIFSYALDYKDYKPLAHFILCFVLLLRIFQTYVVAALDYNKWELKFSDMFLIFIVGLLEYLAFSSLGAAVPGGSYNFDVVTFHKRFLIIAGFALIGYLGAMRVIYRSRFGSATVPAENFKAEMLLQLANISGVAILQIISVCIISSTPFSDGTYIALALTQATILILNIVYSLRTTFRKPKIEIRELKSSEYKLAETLAPAEKQAGIIIRKARRQDVDELVDLLSNNFLYVYETMFDTSRRLTKKMIRSILTAVWGKHEWGFQRFNVAVDAETGKVVGVLRMDTAESGIGLKHFTSIFILIIIIIRYIGITGLIRTIKNSKAVQAASYPIFQSDELQIPYLAVDGEHRRKSIGSELLKFALAEARNKGKEYAALEVREHNKTAISFFMQNGFEKDSVIESEYDYLFGKGRRFRMKKKVELENTAKLEPAVEKNKKLSV